MKEPVDYIELNLCNYSDDDVAQLNEWAIWAFGEIERLRGLVDEAGCIMDKFRHFHVGPEEKCSECGLNFRNQIHRRAA